MRVIEGVILVGSPVESELVATALSPDCGELGPSPFIRDSIRKYTDIQNTCVR